MKHHGTTVARRRRAPVHTPLAVALALAGVRAEAAPEPLGPEPGAPQASFSSAFLHGGGSIDLSRFERGNVTLAGIYRPLIRINDIPLPEREIIFRQAPGSANAQPCLDRSLLMTWGIDLQKVDAAAERGDSAHLPAEPFCGRLDTYIPNARIDFDDGEQVLNVSVPQAFMQSFARGYVSPDLWDEGAEAVMLNYNVSSYRLRDEEGRSNTSTYISLRGGVNLGGWRIRQTGSMSLGGGKRRWNRNQTFAQHDLTDARAQLTVGETYTSGDILGAVRVRGASIKSDTRMLPASQRGYAPTIRGVADSNAQVVVRQNGHAIYSTTVAPGAFVIDDLFPTGYGSDLEVVITEADGRTKTIVVPFTAVPQMVRKGTTLFEVAAGQVAEDEVPGTPFVFQATAQHGISDLTTLYGGTAVSNSYWSGVVGAAFNLPVGAIAVDVTGTRAALRRGDIKRGVSTRIRYNRTFDATGTRFAMAAYRFSTPDYLELADAARLRSAGRGERVWNPSGERTRLSATVSQQVGFGSFQLTGSRVGYWKHGSSTELSLGFGSSWRSLNYNVSVQRSRVGTVLAGATDRDASRTDTTFFVSLSMPLGDAPASPRLSAGYRGSSNQSRGLSANVNGAFDEESNLTWNASATRDAYGSQTRQSFGAGLGYRTYAGTYRINATRGNRGATQLAGTATGAIVAHRSGVTLAQELSETSAIIHAPGAAGARVEGYPGIRLDSRGNAIVPSLLPYQINRVSIDPRGMSHDVELASTSETIVPRAGAISRIDYRSTVATSVLIQATQPDGSPLPFGASVFDASGQAVGVVGQGSKIFARGELAGARLSVRWGDGDTAGCTIELPTSLDGRTEGLHRSVVGRCTPDASAMPELLRPAA
jgi:outer membrane usher protein